MRYWDPTGSGGFVHSALLTVLPAATVISYRVHGVDAIGGKAVSYGTFDFKTAALSPQEPTKIALLADQGTFMGFGANVTSAMIRDFGTYPGEGWPALIHHGGDISYAGIDSNIPELNVTSADEWEFIWDQYGEEMMVRHSSRVFHVFSACFQCDLSVRWSFSFSLVLFGQPLTRHVPFMTTVGNHESFYNWSAFTHRYTMPGHHTKAETASGGNGNVSTRTLARSYTTRRLYTRRICPFYCTRILLGSACYI